MKGHSHTCHNFSLIAPIGTFLENLQDFVPDFRDVRLGELLTNITNMISIDSEDLDLLVTRITLRIPACFLKPELVVNHVYFTARSGSVSASILYHKHAYSMARIG